MPYKYHKAGESARDMASRRRKSALWIALIGIAAVIVVGLFLQNANALGISGTGVLILLILFKVITDFIEKRVDKKLKEEKRAIRGAKAEEKIGGLLADLSEDYIILNDILSPYGNIDHIVLGKNNGIFLIETKAHGGKVTADGENILVNGKSPEKDFIGQAVRNTYWLRDEVGPLLDKKPWITPVLVFTNAFVPPMRPIKGVTIVNKKYLPAVLNRPGNSSAINAQIWVQRDVIKSKLV